MGNRLLQLAVQSRCDEHCCADAKARTQQAVEPSVCSLKHIIGHILKNVHEHCRNERSSRILQTSYGIENPNLASTRDYGQSMCASVQVSTKTAGRHEIGEVPKRDSQLRKATSS